MWDLFWPVLAAVLLLACAWYWQRSWPSDMPAWRERLAFWGGIALASAAIIVTGAVAVSWQLFDVWLLVLGGVLIWLGVRVNRQADWSTVFIALLLWVAGAVCASVGGLWVFAGIAVWLS